jgi:hypothetical protein
VSHVSKVMAYDTLIIYLKIITCMIKQNSEQVVVHLTRCQTLQGCLVFHIDKNKLF